MVIKKPKATNPSWGGRFEDAVNKLTVSYTSSLDQDKRMYQEDIVGSMKYAQALKEAKVITTNDYSKILKGLKTIQKEIESGKFNIETPGYLRMTVVENTARYEFVSAEKEEILWSNIKVGTGLRQKN